MNQFLAMLFPLVGVAAIGLTALFIVKPWRKHRRPAVVPVQPAVREELAKAMKDARAAFENAERVARQAGEAVRTLVP